MCSQFWDFETKFIARIRTLSVAVPEAEGEPGGGGGEGGGDQPAAEEASTSKAEKPR